MTQQVITAFLKAAPTPAGAIDELAKASIPRTSIRLLPDADTGSRSTAARSPYDRTA